MWKWKAARLVKIKLYHHKNWGDCPHLDLNKGESTLCKSYKENDFFTPCVKQWFHTTTKKQTGYSRFVIPISTIPITKHHFSSFFLKLSLSSQMLSPPLPEIFLLLHWCSTPPQICPHEAMDISLPKVFPLSKFEAWKSWSLKELISNQIWI